jgi:hypothetical protein
LLSQGRRSIEHMFGTAGLVDLPDVALSDRVLEIAAEVERAKAALLRAVAAWDGSGAWRADGALDPQAWLSARARMTRDEAHRVVRSARLLRRHEQTEKAVAASAVTVSQVDALARAAANGHDALYAQHEEQLLEAARTVEPRDFGRVAQRWRVLADDQLSRRDANAIYDRRHVYVAQTFAGAGTVHMFLDREALAIFTNTLEVFDTGPDPTGGSVAPRSLALRRADALIDLCCAATSNGKRPGVQTNIDLVATVVSSVLAEQRQDIVGTGPISTATFERLCCDATVRGVLRDGENLQLGRATRLVSDAQRRALVHRDAGCVFRDCGRPPMWCDAHHIIPWQHGGRTDLDNLILLCRGHHRLVHEGRGTIDRAPPRST